MTVLTRFVRMVSPSVLYLFRGRYPRACHLICLRVPVEQENVAAEGAPLAEAGRSSSGALTPSKGKGRAMHGQRMVEWLEVRHRCTLTRPSSLFVVLAVVVHFAG